MALMNLQKGLTEKSFIKKKKEEKKGTNMVLLK